MPFFQLVMQQIRRALALTGGGLLLGCTLFGCAAGQSIGTSVASGASSNTSSNERARAVILFVGDGMGVSTVTAGRIYAGQKLGLDGEEHALSFEDFPNLALIKTYNTDLQVPDSAGTMTAIVTGKKTRAGVLSIGPEAPRGDCTAAREHSATTFLEMAEARGWRTGVVSTATITHATPAATYAHSADRNWESDATMPAAARERGCRDIATQLIEFDQQPNVAGSSDGVDVMLGGGRAMFLPSVSYTHLTLPTKA